MARLITLLTTFLSPSIMHTLPQGGLLQMKLWCHAYQRSTLIIFTSQWSPTPMESWYLLHFSSLTLIVYLLCWFKWCSSCPSNQKKNKWRSRTHHTQRKALPQSLCLSKTHKENNGTTNPTIRRLWWRSLCCCWLALWWIWYCQKLSSKSCLCYCKMPEKLPISAFFHKILALKCNNKVGDFIAFLFDFFFFYKGGFIRHMSW